MNYILFDDRKRSAFLPLAFTRPVSDLLSGIQSNRSRWESYLKSNTSSLTETYLQAKYAINIEKNNILINGRSFPNQGLIEEIDSLETGEKLIDGSEVLAINLSGDQLSAFLNDSGRDRLDITSQSWSSEVSSKNSNFIFEKIWDFFKMNGDFLKWDFDRLNQSEFNSNLGESATFIGSDSLIHKDAIVTASILDSRSGPIIIDKGAEVMPGCLIKGPFYLGKHSTLKMGAKIYGPTSIGDHAKVGGEVNNSIINAYSNKAHDGFLGNAVLGQWCNLGADSNNSNLKNDYSDVKLWDYERSSFIRSGLQFLGLVMGDHSKCGINTMFNTGTVVGVGCNVYGSGFQPNFIPSFSWGKPGSFTTYHFEKAMKVAKIVMQRREISLDEDEINLLQYLFEGSEELRQKFNKAP